MHVLSLVLPVALVAHDVLQVFVALYVVGAHDVARLAYHLVGYARLACNLDGERRSRLTDGELEERSHLVAVVEHGAVGYAVVRVGVVLQVLVVGGYHAPCVLLHKLVEHSLCHSAANLRLGARAKLVDEQQRAFARLSHHVLHVQQVRRVGREVVLYALLVADVDHYVAEDAHLRSFAHGDGQSALQHVLQQTHRLQAHRLAAGVRTRYNQYVAVARQHDVERHDRLLLLLQREPQERMLRRNPVDHGLRAHLRLDAARELRKLGARTNEVYLGKHAVGVHDVVHVRTHKLRELREYHYYLAALVCLQLAYAVVRLNHLRRLHEHRLSRRRLVVYDALYAALHGRSDRHNETTVAQRRRNVLVDEALTLCGVQYAI